MLLPYFLALALLCSRYHVQAKAVFAHFMVSNAVNYTASDWEDDIQQAQNAHITAFALNMASSQAGNAEVVAAAFTAAANKHFQLFFSFDYAGNGPWDKQDVVDYISKYSETGQYYRFNGQPFVSTFEGPGNANDWVDIKSITGCFFVPDWSSLGAKVAMQQANGVADGLFSWAAWPWGPQNMDTYTDASYLQYLNGKPYMMPVSPWFYTNLPEWDKNWLWRGDNLWYDRWNEVAYVQPEWVEIISWNDYGESHYIGPIRDHALGAMSSAPFNYVANMPHDAWRTFLPYAIDMYVQNVTIFTQEGVTFWYRPNPATACSDGSSTGNTASQLQIEFPAGSVMGDAVFYTALLSTPADVSVSIGGVTQAGSWSDVPDGNIGLYHGNVSFNGHVGEVVVSLSRSGTVFASGSGISVTTDCSSQAGLVNWNAYVGAGLSNALVVEIPYRMNDKVCVRGTGAYNFAGLCEFACEYGYCPIGACLCQGMGEQKTKPNSTGIQGYPIAGEDPSYSGLCSFNCNLGFCPPTACGTVEVPLTIPTVSDFLPPACIAGEGPGNWGGLCGYSCHFGFCPIQICTCTQTGALVVPPPTINNNKGLAVDGVNDYGLCDFTCQRGYCPDAACKQTVRPGSGGGTPAYIDPGIWTNPDPTPVVGCAPPCVVVLPPYILPTTTTLTCDPLTTTFTESWVEGTSTVTVSTITFPPIHTTAIPVYNINIAEEVATATYTVTPSLFCVAPITVSPPGQDSSITTSRITYYISTTPSGSTTWPTVTNTKTKVSFTSTTSATPTCTSSCGKLCKGDNCNDCNGSGCSCSGCCSGCSGGGGGGGGGGPPKPKPCLGFACPPGTGPPHSGGGNDDDSCDTKTTVVDTTVICTLSASPGALTMETTCTTTEYETTSGCSISATLTTAYTAEACPTLPPYKPIYSDYSADLPTPGDPYWGGYTFATGTYVGGQTGSPGVPSPTAPPGPCISMSAQYNDNSAQGALDVWDFYVKRGDTQICNNANEECSNCGRGVGSTDYHCLSGWRLTVVLSSGDLSVDDSHFFLYGDFGNGVQSEVFTVPLKEKHDIFCQNKDATKVGNCPSYLYEASFNC